ncbi:MarR family winged helix-turn-helix transcriptional regulator [Luteimicrobium sp. DT211]|uniref:MarR family winged helix-turn-helix transcriptional regulator n=1 Tax=Luteimicrobium sp. DT211 TaxID=3393412 RepID=UPI003CF161CD
MTTTTTTTAKGDAEDGARRDASTVSEACRRVDLGQSLGILLRRWHDAVDLALAGIPHGPRGFQVLGAVVHDEPPTQAALAESLGIDRTVMTYLLDDLTAEGLVERREAEHDRRARRVVATASGRAALRRFEDAVRVAEESVLCGLDDDERELLQGLVRRSAHASPA